MGTRDRVMGDCQIQRPKQKEMENEDEEDKEKNIEKILHKDEGSYIK